MICRSWQQDCLLAAVSCIAFTAVYQILRKAAFPNMPAGFCNRMTSLVHALLMLGLSACCIDFSKAWSDFGNGTSPSQVPPVKYVTHSSSVAKCKEIGTHSFRATSKSSQSCACLRMIFLSYGKYHEAKMKHSLAHASLKLCLPMIGIMNIRGGTELMPPGKGSIGAIQGALKWLTLQAICLSITLGYFVYDTIGVLLIENDWGNTVHHLASMLAISVGVFQRISGSELVWSLFLMELSNPLLHLQSYFTVSPSMSITRTSLRFSAFVLLTGSLLVASHNLNHDEAERLWSDISCREQRGSYREVSVCRVMSKHVCRRLDSRLERPPK